LNRSDQLDFEETPGAMKTFALAESDFEEGNHRLSP